MNHLFKMILAFIKLVHRKFFMKKRLLVSALVATVMIFAFSHNAHADECSACSVSLRSDSMIGAGGIEYLVQQQDADVSPLNAEFRFGGLYDSRVGSSSGSGDEDSDSTLTTRLAVGWQIFLKDNFGLRLDYRGYADFHKDYSEYNVLDHSVSLEPQYKFGSLVFSLPLSLNITLEEGKHDYNRYAVSPTLTYLIPDTRQAVAVYGIWANLQDKDYDEWYDDDGKTFGGGLAYLYYFANKSRIRFFVDYQHTTYDSEVWQYEITSDFSEKRKSDALAAGVDVLFQITDHFGLYANYAFISSESNVDLYDYGRHLVEGGLALKF